ncbi:MAG TPA: FtsX-like permease family protein, partial [Candidatus Sulfotelmatobacter sp.]|nr:FtsX-like permease family protein [Candidatus Sulfotelmatobacter sp.]
ATFFLVESGFREAMGINLRRGRFVTDQDNENTPIVIDIDENFARTYFPGQDPIGKHINFTEFNVQAEVVGVVGHVKQYALDADPPGAIQAQFFYPFMQIPEKVMSLVAKSVAVVLRTHGDPIPVMGQVRETVRGIDPRDVVYNVQTMDEVVAISYAARRLTMILLTGFAALAIMLACVGIYGVVSYMVGQRTQEIGIRMALGAQQRDVLVLVLGEGSKMALIGAGLGIAASLLLTRLMAKQLFGVSAHDPLTYASVAIVLILVAIAACSIPAMRAVRMDPMKSLRWE